MTILNLLLFILSLIVLFYSGRLLVSSLTVLGRYMQFSEYAVAFILVAFATSLPELFVGINSALNEASLLSLGNLTGANFLNISLVLGVAIIFSRGLDTSKTIEKEDLIFALGIMVTPIFMVLDSVISRMDGLILLTLFTCYIVYLIKTEHKKYILNEIGSEDVVSINPLKYFFIFLAGMVLLLASTYFVVSYSVDAAVYLALPLFVVGILVAFGTTLPEVVFSFESASLKHGHMSLGNVFGSVVVNIAFILGLVAVIQPIAVGNVNRVIIGFSLTAVLALIIQILNLKKSRLELWLGVVLVFIALIFVAIEALIK